MALHRVFSAPRLLVGAPGAEGGGTPPTKRSEAQHDRGLGCFSPDHAPPPRLPAYTTTRPPWPR
jgi:hypothetical protein